MYTFICETFQIYIPFSKQKQSYLLIIVYFYCITCLSFRKILLLKSWHIYTKKSNYTYLEVKSWIVKLSIVTVIRQNFANLPDKCVKQYLF